LGEVIVETLDYDGGRKVTVYRPSKPPEAVVFSGDGELVTQWRRALEIEDLPPVMIVGAHRTGSSDEMDRLREYSPVFHEERFAAHEEFFVNDVRALVGSKFGVAMPASRTIVAGVSASAEFSLAMGMRHPDIYGTVFAASPGAGYRPPAVLPAILPRIYLTAGSLEPFFLENASRWADALRTGGADVVLTTPVGNHGDAFWEAEFVKMLACALQS
jgi:enterochelin esterase-like enzyme